MDGLPTGHMLRYLLNNELGQRLADRAAVSGDRADLAAILDAFGADLPFIDATNPMFGHSFRQLLGAELIDGAMAPSAAAVASLLERTGQAAASITDDPVEAARAQFLHGMALALAAFGSEDEETLHRTVTAIEAAGAALPLDDEMQPVIVSVLGALLADRNRLHGVRADMEVARRYLRHADEVVAARGGGDAAAASLRATHGHVRMLLALGRPDAESGPAADEVVAELRAAAAEISAALATMPAGAVWRPQALVSLGLAELALGQRTDDTAVFRAGAWHLLDATDEPGDGVNQQTIAVLGGVAALVLGLLDDAGELIEAGIDAMDEALEAASFRSGQAARLRIMLALAFEARHARGGAAPDLDAAIAHLDLAVAEGAGQPGFAASAPMLTRLMEALVRRDGPGDRPRALEVGVRALRAGVADVVMQAELSDGLVVATTAAATAHRVVDLALAEPGANHRPEAVATALRALELGRGLILHAATTTATMPELLVAAGQPELAREYGRRPTPATTGSPGTGAKLAEAAQVAELAGLTGASEPAGTVALTSNGPATSIVTEHPPPNDRWERAVGALRRAPAPIAAAGERAIGAIDGLDGLLSPPTPEAIGAALATAGHDYLVYLLPGDETRPGRALVARAGDGRLDALTLDDLDVGPNGADLAAYAERRRRAVEAGPATAATATANWRTALRDLCRWAGRAVARPLLAQLAAPADRPTRLLLVPCGALGVVPWHAAVTGTDGPGRPRYACQDVAISYAATARQFVEVAHRPALPLAAAPAFVAPVADRYWSTRVVAAARDLYRSSRVYGRPRAGGGSTVGAGTRDDVLGLLLDGPGAAASLLHIGSHALTRRDPLRSEIQLARPSGPLDVATILRAAADRDATRAGGAVLLPACGSDLVDTSHDEALTLATALLAAGGVGVVGTRWAVDDFPTAVLMFMVHQALAGGAPLAEALRSAQLWMIDPDREIPDDLPADIAEMVRTDAAGPAEVALEDVSHWGAFAHHGGGG